MTTQVPEIRQLGDSQTRKEQISTHGLYNEAPKAVSNKDNRAACSLRAMSA